MVSTEILNTLWAKMFVIYVLPILVLLVCIIIKKVKFVSLGVGAGTIVLFYFMQQLIAILSFAVYLGMILVFRDDYDSMMSSVFAVVPTVCLCLSTFIFGMVTREKISFRSGVWFGYGAYIAYSFWRNYNVLKAVYILTQVNLGRGNFEDSKIHWAESYANYAVEEIWKGTITQVIAVAVLIALAMLILYCVLRQNFLFYALALVVPIAIGLLVSSSNLITEYVYWGISIISLVFICFMKKIKAFEKAMQGFQERKEKRIALKQCPTQAIEELPRAEKVVDFRDLT